MRRIVFNMAMALVLLAIVAASALAAPGSTSPEVAKKLAELRRAMAQYQNAELPTADGVAGPYVQVSPNVPQMGYHYVNFSLFDTVVNEATLEILLYTDTPNGGRRLVGVEYFAIDVGQPAPVLFGRTLEPMPPHEPGMPPHYDLHVWIWEGNPDGIFAEFNPNLP